MSADLYFTRVSFFFLSSFFLLFSPPDLRDRWTELNENRPHGRKCNLQTHVRNLGCPLPLQIGTPKTPFWTTSQPNCNFNGLYIRNEAWYRQSVKCVDNYEGSSTSCQNVMNFGPQTASNSTCILPTLRKFCILLHCQASQTDISK